VHAERAIHNGREWNRQSGDDKRSNMPANTSQHTTHATDECSFPIRGTLLYIAIN